METTPNTTEAAEWLTQTVRGLARAHHLTITEARRLTRHVRTIEPPLNEPRWIRGHGRTPVQAVLDAKRIVDNAKPPIA